LFQNQNYLPNFPPRLGALPCFATFAFAFATTAFATTAFALHGAKFVAATTA
jgi:hypothetical protein